MTAARTYLIFGDIEGKLDVLRVECSKCSRKGRYSVRKLIKKYGHKGNIAFRLISSSVTLICMAAFV